MASILGPPIANALAPPVPGVSDGAALVALTRTFCATHRIAVDHRRRGFPPTGDRRSMRGRAQLRPGYGGRHSSDPAAFAAVTTAQKNNSPTPQVGGRHDSDAPM